MKAKSRQRYKEGELHCERDQRRVGELLLDIQLLKELKRERRKRRWTLSSSGPKADFEKQGR